jgi:PAS domain S-box-containing protein
MKRSETKKDDPRFEELRRKAEETLKKIESELAMIPDERVQHLAHELHVHQIELEMQNEELRRAHEELEESRSKYSYLYDIAPIGYFTGDQKGTILEINLTGAKLLGYERRRMIGKSFALHLQQAETQTFYSHLNKVFESELKQSCELKVRRKDRSEFHVRLESIASQHGGGIRCFTAIIDITERKQAEEALKKTHAELEERVKERTRELTDSQQQLRNLYSHLQSLREEERINIAREIHDDLGQALTALKMDLSWIAGKLRGDNKGLKERLNADVDQVDKTIQAVKRVCTELRPGILDHLGLAAAIEWQAEEFQRRTQIKCEVVFDPEDIEVDPDLKTPLFRIFQEALTNILKHAKAERVKASFRRTSSNIMLKIVDNGIGITEEDLSKPNSFGLMGMRERVYPWGGKVTVSGVENEGTIVEVIIPVTTGEPYEYRLLMKPEG